MAEVDANHLFDRGRRPGYRRAVTTSRQAALVLAPLLVLSACSSSQELPSTLPEVEEEGGSRPLPGDPVLLELDNNRAHVVRLVEPEALSEIGHVQISSTVAGVMVTIDGGDPLPLPQALELAAGLHEVVAGCPDTTVETMTITVEPAVTVHLRVCNNVPRP